LDMASVLSLEQEQDYREGGLIFVYGLF